MPALSPLLRPAWTPLRHHPTQSRLWRSTARFKAVAAGRGSGKTEIARRKIVTQLPLIKPWSDAIYFYAAPTRDQVKKLAWGKIKSLVPREWIAEVSETELSIATVFGSKLFLLGMDKPQRAEGVQWDFGIVDESCDQKPGVFDLNLRPALSHRNAECWRIGVPKRAGPGATEFKEFYESGLPGDNKDPDVESFTWPSSDILTESEVASAKRQLDQKDFNEQYGASWETIGGAVFYAFSDVLNVNDQLAYSPALPLLVGCDFNVDPMAWVVAQVRGRELLVFDELWIRNTNTEAALKELHARYGSHAAGVRFFGDATGKARKTAASFSDYIQIKNFMVNGKPAFDDSLVMFPEANPPRHDRFASCNALFCNAAQERRCFIHPRCRNLIKDLNARAYEPGTSEPDDSGDISHASDALGYLIHRLFPLTIKQSDAPPSIPSLL